MSRARPALLIALREARLLSRSRAALVATSLLAVVAWLPALLPPLRRGSLGLAPFQESLPLHLALAGVVLPLLAILAGAELFAGELEDGSLVPILTLPVSRKSCFIGKCFGRAVVLGLTYLAAVGSAGIGIATASGADGLADWAAVNAAGLLLVATTGAIGVALGAGARGRIRAFGTALLAWLVLVFVLDAALLATVVASAPPPPQEIGTHGHAEVAPSGSRPTEDPHARHAESASPSGPDLAGSLMVVNPVSLFRLTALAASPTLRGRMAMALPGFSGAALSATLAIGWIFWLAGPFLVGLGRFLRADLS